MSEIAIDPNSQQGFDAALAAQVGRAVPERAYSDGTDVSAALGATDPAAAVPATPATPDPGTPAEPTADAAGTPASGEDVYTHDDPEVAALLERYGGNLDEALRGAVEAQRLIGRQGNELGEIRRRLDEIDQRSATAPQASPTHPHYNPMAVDVEAVVENGDAEGFALQLIDAMEAGDPNASALYDRLMASWVETEPWKAQRLANAYQETRIERMLERRLSQTESQVRETALESSLANARDEAATRHPDWDALQGTIVDLLDDDTVPEVVKLMVVGGTPQEQAQGIDILAGLARGIRAPQLAAEAARTASLTAPEREAQIRAAHVASGGLRVAAPAAPGAEQGQDALEEAKARFRERILRTETTSVSEGLTGLN